MKKWISTLLMTAILAMGFAGSALAANTKDDAKAMVKKAVAFYKSQGKEKALAEYSNPKGQFVKGELYLTVWDLVGNQIAHGDNQKLIGKNMLDLKDKDGKAFVKEFMEIGKTGQGWVDYKWTNPASKKIENKSVYMEKVDDTLVGCGIYTGE